MLQVIQIQLEVARHGFRVLGCLSAIFRVRLVTVVAFELYLLVVKVTVKAYPGAIRPLAVFSPAAGSDTPGPLGTLQVVTTDNGLTILLVVTIRGFASR